MDETRKTTIKWLGAFSALIGAWVAVSPFVLGFDSGIAIWNSVGAGLAVVLLGLYQVADPEHSWPSWVNLLVALWLVAFPYALNPPESLAYTNAVWSGILLGLIALSDALTVASRGPEATHRSM